MVKSIRFNTVMDIDIKRLAMQLTDDDAILLIKEISDTFVTAEFIFQMLQFFIMKTKGHGINSERIIEMVKSGKVE